MPGLDPVLYVRVSPTGKNLERVEDQTRRILALAYEDDEKQADKLKLTVDNYDLTQIDAPIWRPGNHVEVAWGYAGNMSPARQMKIQNVKGGTVLSIECLDEQVLMSKVQRVRAFENVRRSDVARQIAEEYGWDSAHARIDDTAEVLEQVTQARMTDAQLLRDMAKREGFEFYVDFDGFHFHKRDLAAAPRRRFTWFTDPGRGDVLSWSVDKDVFTGGKTGSVKVVSKDPMKTGPNRGKSEVTADADAESGRTTLAPEGGLVGVKDGVVISVHDAEDGARAAGAAVVPSTEKTAASAQRQASGMFAKAQLQAIELTMECIGDPQMLAKTLVEVHGIGKTLSGNYFVTKVEHKLGAGYTMTLKLKRDGKSSGATAGGQAFQKSQPKPEAPTGGSENAQPAADGGLTTKVEGGVVTYQEAH